MKRLVLFFSIAFIAALTGCASVPMASLDQDTSAKDFIPPQNKASLYIYRNETLGAAVPITVSVNDRTIGQTASMTYFRFDVTPGKYVVKAHAENIAELNVNTEPGRNYFIWQEMKMGLWSARAKLTQVDETTGRAGVAESKLIATTVTENELGVISTDATHGSVPASDIDLTASQKLRELQKLKEEGVITEEEFDVKKAQLLESL